MITSFLCVDAGGPSQGIIYSYTYISYFFSGNVNTPLPHFTYLIYLHQHVFMFAIVLSVLLRYTDSDYLPLVSSNSSYTTSTYNTVQNNNYQLGGHYTSTQRRKHIFLVKQKLSALFLRYGNSLLN
jgi:hypothetical protein